MASWQANVHVVSERESFFSTEGDRTRLFPSAGAAPNALARMPPWERLGELGIAWSGLGFSGVSATQRNSELEAKRSESLRITRNYSEMFGIGQKLGGFS